MKTFINRINPYHTKVCVSAASWGAETALLWKRRSVLKSCAISRTNRWNVSFLISNSVLFWYFLISLRATVPALKRWGFFTPPVAGADFLAALVASCFLGALPPVDLRAVCVVPRRNSACLAAKSLRDPKLFVLCCTRVLSMKLCTDDTVDMSRPFLINLPLDCDPCPCEGTNQMRLLKPQL